MFAHVSHWLYRHLLWLLLVAYVGTLHLWRQDLKISIILLLLASLLFNAGLGMKLADVRSLVRTRRLLTTGLLANILVPIAYTIVVAAFMRWWHNPDETQNILIGLALVATMPIAGSSPPGHRIRTAICR